MPPSVDDALHLYDVFQNAAEKPANSRGGAPNARDRDVGGGGGGGGRRAQTTSARAGVAVLLRRWRKGARRPRPRPACGTSAVAKAFMREGVYAAT